MSEISVDELRTNIVEILKTADLSVLTSKTVREKLEKKLGYSLVSRKKQIDAIVMDEINKKGNCASESESEEENESESKQETRDESEEEERPAKRAAAPARRAPAKKKRKSINDSDDGDSDDGSDEDYKSTKKSAKKKKAGNGPKKGTGFTRPYNLSPELSALMGSDSLPRHAVVKKIWSIIKERNLYDPKNKQYAICDDQLLPIMKVKRFRTFGMLKYLKPHFIN